MFYAVRNNHVFSVFDLVITCITMTMQRCDYHSSSTTYFYDYVDCLISPVIILRMIEFDRIISELDTTLSRH